MIDRATRLAEGHPAWSVVNSRSDYILTVSDRRAQLSGRTAQTRAVEYDGNVPGSAARTFADAFSQWLDQFALLEQERHQARFHQLFRQVEALVRDLEIALDENKDLRYRLREARIEIDFLRRQVQQLGEALKTNRPGIARAMLIAVGSILFALTTGMGEAVGSRILDKAGMADTTTQMLLERCDDLASKFDMIEGNDA